MVFGHGSRTPRRGPEPQATVGRRVVLATTGLTLLAGATAALGGCRARPSPPPTAAPSLDALAGRYVTLTRRLARHQPSLVEVWLGADEPLGPREPVAGLLAEIDVLQGELAAAAAAPDGAPVEARARALSPTSAHRVAYLAGQVQALQAAAARLLGRGQAFADEARRSLGVVAPPRDAAALDALRAELSRLLPGPGPLADRHAAFRRAAAVPADRVERVFTAAVEWCRTAARAQLPLPAGEALTTRAEDTGGWAAFSRPTGPRTSDLWVARQGGADAAHLLQLAAHEGTPGHHAQHVLAQAALVDARGWTERRLHPSFGPHRLLAEGAAEAGAELLLPLAVRERVCAEVLLPLAGQAPSLAARLARVERLTAALDLEVAYIAADYLDTALGTGEATTRLRDDALVLDPAGMVGFIEKQRARMLAYPVGRRLVLDAVRRAPTDTWWPRLSLIATTLSLHAVSGE